MTPLQDHLRDTYAASQAAENDGDRRQADILWRQYVKLCEVDVKRVGA